MIKLDLNQSDIYAKQKKRCRSKKNISSTS